MYGILYLVVGWTYAFILHLHALKRRAKKARLKIQAATEARDRLLRVVAENPDGVFEKDILEDYAHQVEQASRPLPMRFSDMYYHALFWPLMVLFDVTGFFLDRVVVPLFRIPQKCSDYLYKILMRVP